MKVTALQMSEIVKGTISDTPKIQAILKKISGTAHESWSPLNATICPNTFNKLVPCSDFDGSIIAYAQKNNIA